MIGKIQWRWMFAGMMLWITGLFFPSEVQARGEKAAFSNEIPGNSAVILPVKTISKEGYGSKFPSVFLAEGAGQVCEGSSAVLFLLLEGEAGDFRVRLRQVTTHDQVVDSLEYSFNGGRDTLRFTFQALTEHEGGYCFELYDAADGRGVRTDTLQLEISPAIRTTILLPRERDTLVCPGNVPELIGSGWTNEDGRTGSVYWLDGRSGEILGDGDAFTPEEMGMEGGLYVYRAVAHGCVWGDTVRLQVRQVGISLPEQLHGVEGEEVEVNALDYSGHRAAATHLKWYRGEVEVNAAVNPLHITASASEMLEVRDEQEGCELEAFCWLEVRKNVFLCGGGGDGFGIRLPLKATLSAADSSVCSGDTVEFTARVYGAIRPVAVHWQCHLPDAGMVDLTERVTVSEGTEGEYHCRIKMIETGFYVVQFADTVSGVVTSDSIWMEVRERPLLTVPADTLLCPGDKLVAEGECSLSGAICSWYAADGSLITSGSVLPVNPVATTVYIFRSDNEGCIAEAAFRVVRDTILQVHLPVAMRVTEGATVELTATGYGGRILGKDSLVWYNEGVEQPLKANPYLWTAGSHTVRISAVYTSGYCRLMDSVKVEVRPVGGNGDASSGGMYGGGGGDGYARTPGFKVLVAASAEELTEGYPVALTARVDGMSGIFRYHWYKKAEIIGEADVEVFSETDSSRMYWEAVRLEDGGTYYCVVEQGDVSQRSAEIILRVRKQYRVSGMLEDGFAVNCVAPLLFEERISSASVCANEEKVEMEVAVSAIDLVCCWQRFNTETGSYEGLGTADERLLGTDSSHLTIFAMQENDGGLYRCVLSNRCRKGRVENGQVKEEIFFSDTVYSNPLTLTVRHRPQIYITEPVADTVAYCPGVELRLHATSSVAGLEGAENFWIDYRTEGDEIVVAPALPTSYVYYSSYDGCVNRDTVWVIPDTSSVMITPRYQAVAAGTLVNFKALASSGVDFSSSSFRWLTGDSVLQYGGAHMSLKHADSSRFIRAELITPGKCVIADSAYLHVRTLYPFVGGKQDGFTQTSNYFEVEVSSPLEVCAGGQVMLQASVVYGREDINYSCQWYCIRTSPYTGVSDTVPCRTEGMIAILEDITDSDDSPRYFCRVSDGFGAPVVSEEIQFEVVEGIVPAIVAPLNDTTICRGDTLILFGEFSGGNREVHCWWEGEDILSFRREPVIEVAPRRTSEYILRVTNKGCQDSARIRILVDTTDLLVKLPEYVVSRIDEEVELKALGRNDRPLISAYVKWSCEGYSLISGRFANPLRFVPDSSMTVRCVYTPHGGSCSGEAFTRVKVVRRESFVLTGGAGDGFAESCRSYYPYLAEHPDTVFTGDSLRLAVIVPGGLTDVRWMLAYRDGRRDTLEGEPGKGDLFVGRVSMTYDSCRIWCEVMNRSEAACRGISDTVLLHVKNRLQISLSCSADTLLLCGKDSARVIVHLDYGDLPFTYRYRTPDGVNIKREYILSVSDTLYLRKKTGKWLFAVCQPGEETEFPLWTDSVYTEWEERVLVGLELIDDYRVGQCREVDLNKMYRPLLWPEDESYRYLPEGSGVYVVDGFPVTEGQWQPDREGWHSVRYRYGSERCSSSDELRLYVDSLPGVNLTAPSSVCAGEDAEVFVETSGASRTWIYLTREVKDGDGGQRSYHFEKTVEGYRAKVRVGAIESDSCVIIRADSIRDIHGCVTEAKVCDTLYIRSVPVLSWMVAEEEGQIVTARNQIWVEKGDSVKVEACLQEGELPWWWSWSKDTVCIRKGVAGGKDTSFFVNREGRYVLQGGDRYCTATVVDSLWVRGCTKGKLRLFVLLENEMDTVKEEGHGRPVYVEWRYAPDARRASYGADSCHLVLRDTFYAWADGRVRDKEGNDTLVVKRAIMKTDSLYVAVLCEGYLTVLSGKGIDLPLWGETLWSIDLRLEEQLYFRDLLWYHMTPGTDGLWRMSAGDVNENALISVKDENQQVTDSLRRLPVKRNRHRWSEVE